MNAHGIKDYMNDESQAFGFYVQKGLFEEYATFGRGKAHDLADFDVYHKARGLRWPVVDGKETLWRFREGYDTYVPEGRGHPLLRLSGWQGHRSSRCPISRLPKCRTPTSTSGCAPVACWSTGTPVR